MADDQALLYRWKDRVKSESGPGDPVLRLVCLVLAGWWRDADAPEAAIPTRLLCEQTGLRRRVLFDRLRQLDGVWIARVSRPGRPTVYRARIPLAGDACPTVSELREAGGVIHNPCSTEHGSGGGDPCSTEHGGVFHGTRGGCSTEHGASIPTVPKLIHGGDAAALGQEAGGAPPGEQSDQLPLSALFRMHIRDGDREAAAEVAERMAAAARGAGS